MKTEKIASEGLKLSNDGNLQLVFAGVGSAFTKAQYQTNLLIIKGKDHLLVDCGTKCTQSLFELGIPITSIENILITHSHADHIGGLEEIALLGRYVTKKKPNMVISETYQHILWDMSLRGGAAYNEEICGDILSFKDFFNINRPKMLHDFPRETLSAKVGSIDLKMFRTMHIPDVSNAWNNSFWSCGIIIDERVMFTSDTRFDRDLIESYCSKFNFEVIFHDCQFFTGGVHASIEELNTLPADIKAKMILVHYGDNFKSFEQKVSDYGFKGLGQQHISYVFD